MVYRDVPTMVIISNYESAVNDSGEICIKTTEKSFCPICGGALRAIGSRCRYVITADGEKKAYRIRRLRCGESCRKIHHELPDIVVPYKRHGAQTMEKIEEGDIDGLSMESSTIARLLEFTKRMKAHYRNAVSGIKEKYPDLRLPSRPQLREIVRILVNGNLWIHTRSAFCPQ